jgi:hypothetical protein
MAKKKLYVSKKSNLSHKIVDYISHSINELTSPHIDFGMELFFIYWKCRGNYRMDEGLWIL